MRKTATATLAATALVLTGCGKGIDDITPDTPRAEKDEIFIAWAQDTHGDDLPNMDTTVATDWADGLCLSYDMGMEDYFYAGVFEDAEPAQIGPVRNILRTAVKVYCPEHSNA